MDELTAQILLETLEDAGRHATKKQLSNGDYVVVAADGVYLWNAGDTRRWLKGSLQRALARKLRQEKEEALA